jgi:hypothetical protein
MIRRARRDFAGELAGTVGRIDARFAGAARFGVDGGLPFPTVCGAGRVVSA